MLHDSFIDKSPYVLFIMSRLDFDVRFVEESISNIPVRPTGDEDLDGPLRVSQQELDCLDESVARVRFAFVQGIQHESSFGV